MDVIARQNAFDDLDAVFRTDLPTDVTDPQAQLAGNTLKRYFVDQTR
jgi:hypothetical protein